MTRLRGWVPLSLVGLAVVALGVLGLTAPLSYDEGYNLQVPRQLADSGLYATNGSIYGTEGSRAFDVLISTGPTLLLPTGAAFTLFGDHLLVARGVGLLAYLGLVVATALVAVRICGLPAVAPALAGVLAVRTQIDWPHTVIFGPADLLGEHAAAALILFAAMVLRNRPLQAGTVLALAVLTKFLALLALPAFAVALAMSRPTGPLSRSVMLFLSGLAAPLVLWNLWQWVILGSEAFESRISDFLRFATSAGSGIVAGPADTSLRFRLAHLGEYWHVPALPLVTLALVGLSLAIRRGHSSDMLPAVAVDHSKRAMSWAIGGSAITVATWWLLVSDRAFGRHLLIAPLIATPLVAGWLMSTPRIEPPRAALKAAWLGVSVVALTVLATGVVLRAHSLIDPPGPLMAEQRRAAAALADAGAPAFTFHGSWWQAPEIAFLSGMVAVPDADPLLPLVITPLQRTLDPRGTVEADALCAQAIYEADGYRICWQAIGSLSG